MVALPVSAITGLLAFGLRTNRAKCALNDTIEEVFVAH